MSMLSQLLVSSLHNVKQTLLVPASENLAFVRNAAKKVSPSSKNKGGRNPKPKHRTWKVVDGEIVTAGSILATQRTPRWHPGLNAGFGKNGTIWAIEAGRVIVTTEQVDLNWDHTWVQRHYSGREQHVIYKKHFNVIPEEQHGRFKLVDAI